MLTTILLTCASWLPAVPAAIPAQEPQAADAVEVLEAARVAAHESGRNLFVYLEAPW